MNYGGAGRSRRALFWQGQLPQRGSVLPWCCPGAGGPEWQRGARGKAALMGRCSPVLM